MLVWVIFYPFPHAADMAHNNVVIDGVGFFYLKYSGSCTDIRYYVIPYFFLTIFKTLLSAEKISLNLYIKKLNLLLTHHHFLWHLY